MKIAIVGAHGSGKSTILSSVYSELKKNNIRVSLAPEVARSSLFLAAHENIPKMQMDLFGRQISSEMTNSRNCDVLLCDRSLFDILMYTRMFFNNNNEAMNFAHSMESFCKHYAHTYNHIFLTTKLYNPSIVKDDIRPINVEEQKKASVELKKLLDNLSIGYTALGTDPVNEIANWIKADLTNAGTAIR
ncbi:AAA family ATPase [Gynuella sp.]|uniref:AAA family ATPase n=1 Tax=Gynuella sp. TaxID=2969146 RepID=UPI003D13D11A